MALYNTLWELTDMRKDSKVAGVRRSAAIAREARISNPDTFTPRADLGYDPNSDTAKTYRGRQVWSRMRNSGASPEARIRQSILADNNMMNARDAKTARIVRSRLAARQVQAPKVDPMVAAASSRVLSGVIPRIGFGAAVMTAAKPAGFTPTEEMAALNRGNRPVGLGEVRQADAVRRVPAGPGDVRFADRNVYKPEPSFIARTVGQTQRRVQ